MPKDIATEIAALRAEVNLANTIRLAVLIQRAEGEGTTAGQWLKAAVELREALTTPPDRAGKPWLAPQPRS